MFLNAQGDQKRTSDALYLELENFCEVPGMMLEVKLLSSRLSSNHAEALDISSTGFSHFYQVSFISKTSNPCLNLMPKSIMVASVQLSNF